MNPLPSPVKHLNTKCPPSANRRDEDLETEMMKSIILTLLSTKMGKCELALKRSTLFFLHLVTVLLVQRLMLMFYHHLFADIRPRYVFPSLEGFRENSKVHAPAKPMCSLKERAALLVMIGTGLVCPYKASSCIMPSQVDKKGYQAIDEAG